MEKCAYVVGVDGRLSRIEQSGIKGFLLKNFLSLLTIVIISGILYTIKLSFKVTATCSALTSALARRFRVKLIVSIWLHSPLGLRPLERRPCEFKAER